MRRLRFLQFDVFTREPFGGNQLAVFFEGDSLSDEKLQAIAREMNYSESTFILPPSDPKALCRVRIFTPAAELPFAGAWAWAFGGEGAFPLGEQGPLANPRHRRDTDTRTLTHAAPEPVRAAPGLS